MRNILAFIGKKLIKLSHRELYLKLKMGTFDEEIFSTTRKNGIDVVIDVGANHGQFAQKLLNMGFQGTILSFEPMPSTFQSLERAASNHKNWHCFQLALGEEDTTSVIHGHQEDVFTSLLKPSDFGKERFKTLNTSEDVPISVRRLDNVLEELVSSGVIQRDFRAFLKVDTQGYDLNVIRGSTAYMSQILMLQTEASIKPIYDGAPSYIDTFQHIQALGFNPTSFDILSREKSSGNIIEFDILAQR